MFHMMVTPITMFAMLGEIIGAMAATWRDNDLIAGLLMAIFLVTLVIGLVCLLLVVHFVRSGRLALRRESEGTTESTGRRLFHATIGLPTRWLAVKTTQPLNVQEALRLHKPTPCSWAEALANANENKLFISPPLAGWVLVLGSGLPDPAEDIDRCYRFILDLSRKLGHVQFFSFNRLLKHHAWAQVQNGQVLRAYAWAGQAVWNEGQLTRPEVELRMKCFDYAEPVPPPGFAEPDPVAMNTRKVPLLAARWSIDPAAIETRTLRETRGIVGVLIA